MSYITCHNCGARVPHDVQHCPECGARPTEPQNAHPPLGPSAFSVSMFPIKLLVLTLLYNFFMAAWSPSACGHPPLSRNIIENLFNGIGQGVVCLFFKMFWWVGNITLLIGLVIFLAVTRKKKP